MKPKVNPWFIALAVVVPTFMEVLDTTIANVALRYIAGGLSSAVTDSEWVITSYLAANAIILPISGWLAAHLGRRNYFLGSIALFTFSSACCGMASSLNMLILCRIVQGLAGGGLQPSSQGILLDSFPVEKQAAAQTLFGVAALIAPIVGPTLGGYITDEYSWRWIFLINIPVGIMALTLSSMLVHDPEYMDKQRAESSKHPLNFDTLGLSLLSLCLCCWEVLLSKGQEWDWFNDPFWRIQKLTIGFVGALVVLIWWENRAANPIVNFKPLLEKNFATCCCIIFCAYGVLYGSSTLLPSMLEALFGYDALHAGLVLSPAGVSTICAIIMVGALLGRGLDARYLIFTGLVILAAGNYWISLLNLSIDPYQVIIPRMVTVTGLGLVFAPLNVAAYLKIPPQLRGAAVGLLALLRNEGGSVGTSLGQTFLERRQEFHEARLNENLDILNPAVNEFLNEAKPYYLQVTGDSASAQQMALQGLDDMRESQALSLAYFDSFLAFAVVGLCLAGSVFLMDRAVVKKGQHVDAE